MVVFSLDLVTGIILLLVLFVIVMRIVFLKMFLRKKLSPKKSIISDSSAVRTGRFKLIPHGDVYALYAEYRMWVGDIHRSKIEKKFFPANADDVSFYYQQKTNELP